MIKYRHDMIAEGATTWRDAPVVQGKPPPPLTSPPQDETMEIRVGRRSESGIFTS
jgi:hypothetical protein